MVLEGNNGTLCLLLQDNSNNSTSLEVDISVNIEITEGEASKFNNKCNI